MPSTSPRAAAAALAAVLLLSGVGLSGDARQPRLIVVLVVDQMRADYLDRFQHQWTGGLRRLLDRGAVFRQAAYPYLNTITCTGHATIATGSFPAAHGIILNEWWDRGASKALGCTDDPGSPYIGAGRSMPGGASPRRLLLPTLSDELRTQLGVRPRIVTLAGKPRSAIMLAGRRADLVGWFEPKVGGWLTSKFYADTPPLLLQRFGTAESPDKDFGKVWTRREPLERYLYGDDPDGRTPPDGTGPLFPHTLKGPSASADAEYYEAWHDTPFADEMLGRLTSAVLTGMKLGQTASTDFLGVSFSGIDRIGHVYGPFSHEMQDGLMRLDTQLGLLLADLDRLVGPAEYVLALSSDHGSAPVPEQMAKLGFDAGRIRSRPVAERIDRALQPILGPGTYVAVLQNTQLYFRDGVYDRLLANPAAMQAVLNVLEAWPGVRAVFRQEQIERGSSGDPLARTVRLSHYPGRSGEMTVVPKPYWIMSGEAATHGTGYDYDAHVPVILMGKGIKPGEYLTAATPADIAPTLGFLAGVTLARPDGRVLRESLLAAPARKPGGSTTAAGGAR